MKLSKLFALLIGVLMIGSVASAQSSYNVLAGVDSQMNQAYSTKLFQEILDTADLQDMVKYDANGQGFTLFVPTDQAIINDLSRARIKELLTDKEAARYFVMFHMLNGKNTVANLEAFNGQQVNSMSNTALSFTTVPPSESSNGKVVVLVNGASVISGVYQGSNNISVYIIDTVVTP